MSSKEMIFKRQWWSNPYFPLTTGGVSVGLSNGSIAVSFLSGYLKDELPEAATSNALSMGFEKFSVSKGVTREMLRDFLML